MNSRIVIQYDVENPREGDVLVYKGGKWSSVPHTHAFSSEQDEIAKLSRKVTERADRVRVLEGHINTLAQATKENL